MLRAFIGAIMLCIVFSTSAVAQEQPAGIQATGIGTASAPAQSVDLQVLLSSSASFGMAPIGFDPGTPSSEMPPGGMGGMMGMAMLSREQLDPVIAVIAETGIGPDAIAVSVPVYNSFFGPGGPEVAEIRATIDQPQGEDLANLVEAIPVTAQQAGLTVLHIGARYEAADCADLIQQARVAAIADANLRAQGLAQGLGVTLGELAQASESPYFGPAGMDSCALPGTTDSFGPYGPGTDPAFDPDTTEATATVQVTLTYAFEAAA